jgi:hypothetical protein
MPSSIWYYGLVAIGLGITIYTMYTKRKSTNISALITFFLAAMSFTMLVETFVFIMFNSYDYKPNVLTNPFKDSVLGHLLLNTTLWPATGLLAGVFSLRYRWIFLITAIYTLIEVLFLKLGFYEHHWWRLYMTSIAVLLYHIISKIWYKKTVHLRI